MLNPAVAAHLDAFFWTDQFGARAVKFVAGCINLARLAGTKVPFTGAALLDLGEIFSNYTLTLLTLSLHHPALVVISEAGCEIAACLRILTGNAARSRFEQQIAKVEGQELRALVNEFGHARVLENARSILGVAQLPHAVLVRLITTSLDEADNTKCHALVESFAFENAEISTRFRERLQREGDYRRAGNLRVWARYVALDDAFMFCWECIKPPEHPEQSSPFGDNHEDRLKVFEELFTIPPQFDGPPARLATSRWSWRHSALRTFAAIGSLIELRWGDQEERWVRQDEAVHELAKCPDLIPPTVRGILEHCHTHWNALDPIILGLPPESTVPVLSELVDEAPIWADRRHHARRLLAHIKGDAVPTASHEDRGSLLDAAEGLIRATRTRTTPVTAQTWLAEGAIERLWQGALEVAQRQFDEYLMTQYGQEEHEHCAILADALARELNATNAAVQGWLKTSGGQPAFIRASVRRFPKRATGPNVQEGGPAGIQADLALLLRCDVAGTCIARRVTLVQAKKLPARPEWLAECRLRPKEQTQLRRLLSVSQSAHYLFILPLKFRQTVNLLPAMLVRDILAGRRATCGVPVSTLLHAGVRLSDFILYHVIGLWTGDDDAKLIKRVESGSDVGQGPRVVIDVTVSQEGQGGPR